MPRWRPATAAAIPRRRLYPSITSDVNTQLLVKITPHLRELRDVFNTNKSPGSLGPQLSSGLTSLSSAFFKLPTSTIARIQDQKWNLTTVSVPGVVVPPIVQEWVRTKLKDQIVALQGLGCEDLKARLEYVALSMSQMSEEVRPWVQEHGLEVLWIIGGCLACIFSTTTSPAMWICGFGEGPESVIQAVIWDAVEEGAFAYLQSGSAGEGRAGHRKGERGIGALVKLYVEKQERVKDRHEDFEESAGALVEGKEEGTNLIRKDESTKDENAKEGKFEEVEDELEAASKVEDWKAKPKL